MQFASPFLFYQTVRRAVLQGFNEGFYALQSLCDVLNGVGIGNAGKLLAALTEGSSRNNGATVVVKELIAEFLTRKSVISDLGENIEGTLWLEGFNADAL